MAVFGSALDLPAGRLLALDLGMARHGVAVCDETNTVATPLAVVRRHATRAEDFAELQALVNRERVTGVLIGLPVQESGWAEGQARWVLRYGRRLAGTLSVPVAFWDESCSSHDAGVLIRSRRREPLDAVAAALILMDFLEARRDRPSSGGT
jgi:putative Holliday junction resolvase